MDQYVSQMHQAPFSQSMTQLFKHHVSNQHQNIKPITLLIIIQINLAQTQMETEDYSISSIQRSVSLNISDRILLST